MSAVDRNSAYVTPNSGYVLCKHLCINISVFHSGHDCFPTLKESANGVQYGTH